MKIRITASVDLLNKIKGKERIYLNRGSKTEGRVYFDLDDRVAEKLIDLWLEYQAEHPEVSIDNLLTD